MQRIDDTQHFDKITPGTHWIDNDQTYLLFRIDNEQRTYRHGPRLIRVNHVVQNGDLFILIRDDRKANYGILRFLDVLDPLNMLVYRINRQANCLDVAPVKLRLEFRGQAEFCRAYGCEIGGVRKQHHPGFTCPFIKSDPADGRVLLKIRCSIAQA